MLSTVARDLRKLCFSLLVSVFGLSRRGPRGGGDDSRDEFRGSRILFLNIFLSHGHFSHEHNIPQMLQQLKEVNSDI